MPPPEPLVWTSTIVGAITGPLACLGCVVATCWHCYRMPRLKRLIERVAQGRALPAEQNSLRDEVSHDPYALALAHAAATGMEHTGHSEEAERIRTQTRIAAGTIRPIDQMGRSRSTPAFDDTATAAARILRGRQAPANSPQRTPPPTQNMPLRTPRTEPTAGTHGIELIGGGVSVLPQSQTLTVVSGENSPAIRIQSQQAGEAQSSSTPGRGAQTVPQNTSVLVAGGNLDGATPEARNLRQPLPGQAVRSQRIGRAMVSTGSGSSPTSTSANPSNSPLQRSDRLNQSGHQGEGTTARTTSRSLGTATARVQAGGRWEGSSSTSFSSARSGSSFSPSTSFSYARSEASSSPRSSPQPSSDRAGLSDNRAEQTATRRPSPSRDVRFRPGSDEIV